MKAYPNLPSDANVEAWLVRIAHRKAIDVVRARVRHPIPFAEVPDSVSASTVDDLAPDLITALNGLPHKQKHAVAYHYLAGLRYAEVAAILGGSSDAARRAAADGIATLRRSHPSITARRVGPE